MQIAWYKRPFIIKYLRIAKRMSAMSKRELVYQAVKPLKEQFIQFELFFTTSISDDSSFFNKLDLKIPQLKTVENAFRAKDIDTAKLALAEYYNNRTAPAFFFDPDEIISIAKLLHDNAKHQILKQADEILRHNFQLFELRTLGGSRINWHMDPTTGKQWPKIFRNKLHYGLNSQTKDVKYIWELNRHKHFVILGKAYLFTNDERYAQEFAQQINDWIDNNPPEIGINWTSNLEVAMRLISWIWTYHFFKESPCFDESTHFRMIKSIYQHGSHIFSELSIYTCPNNHLIGEATALWMIGLLFPEFKESQKWKNVGFQILETELDKQIHLDGVNAEQAIGYHRFVLDFYTQIVLLAKKNGMNVPDVMMKKIEKMFEFILALADSKGRGPMIGDADNARGMPVANGDFWNFSDSLSTGAVLFNRPDMKILAGKFHEISIWLLGLAGKEKYDSLPDIPRKYYSTAFKHGGYYIMKAEGKLGTIQLVFDCGPLGYSLNAAHGHADMLSFTLNASGHDLIIDPGTFGYACAGDKRDYFRGTRAHNTIVVDDLNQADPSGTFKWLNIPQAKIHRWITTRDYDFVDGSHNGYERLKNPVTHRRMVFFVKPEYWIMVDFLTGHGMHKYDQYFHFPPSCVVINSESKIATITTGDGVNLALIPANPEAVSANLSEGSLDPFDSLVSYSYGDLKPTPAIKYNKKSKTPLIFGTLLFPFSEKSPIPSNVEILEINQREQKSQTIGLKLQTDESRDYFVLSCGESVTKSWDQYQSDADLIFFRKLRNNSIGRSFLLNGSFISDKSRKFIRDKNEIEYWHM